MEHASISEVVYTADMMVVWRWDIGVAIADGDYLTVFRQANECTCQPAFALRYCIKGILNDNSRGGYFGDTQHPQSLANTSSPKSTLPPLHSPRNGPKIDMCFRKGVGDIDCSVSPDRPVHTPTQNYCDTPGSAHSIGTPEVDSRLNAHHITNYKKTKTKSQMPPHPPPHPPPLQKPPILPNNLHAPPRRRARP